MTRRPRALRIDLTGPPAVRQRHREGGPTAVMRSEWRDPDDIKPDARHKPREIDGYRTYCPLRRMARQTGSQITLRHIAAADALRLAVDLAVIGAQGDREQFIRALYGPVSGPGKAAMRQTAAIREAERALRQILPGYRALLTEIVLFNRSLAAWCAMVNPARNPQIEMGRLLGILDQLAAHYASEIDRALARGNVE